MFVSLLPVLPVSVGRNDGVLVPSPCVLGKKVDPAQKGGPLAEMAVSPESFPPPPSEPTSMPARFGYRWRPSSQALSRTASRYMIGVTAALGTMSGEERACPIL